MEFSSLCFLSKKKRKKKIHFKFFFLFLTSFFLISFSDFVFDIFNCLSYSSLLAVAIPKYIYIHIHLFIFPFLFFLFSLFKIFKSSSPALPFLFSLHSPLSFFFFYSPSFPSLFLLSPSKLNYCTLYAVFPCWPSAHAQISRLSIS